MAKITRAQVEKKLDALFLEDGIDLSNVDVKDNASLYAPPFGYDAGSLQLFLRNLVAADPPAGFGVYIEVTDLGDPPTYGALVDKILEKVNAPAPAPGAQLLSAPIAAAVPKPARKKKPSLSKGRGKRP